MGGRRYAVARLVEALLYNPEGRGLDFHWAFEICRRLHPSSRTMALGSTQPLAQMTTRDLPCEVKAVSV
jgi:hypothetical protein